MPNDVRSAGELPAFSDYARLGTSYRLLVEAFQERRMTHAYLLTAPRGVGKLTFARYLACTLFCESDRKPCGACASCKRTLGGSETDVIEVVSADRKLIPIDRIRDMLDRVAEYASRTRVVIIEPIEKLTPQAQNCLLKSLEEPRANVVFLLLSHETSAVLGTIASRCTRVKLHPWTNEQIATTLTRRGVSELDVKRVTPQASGNIGSAIALLDAQQDAAADFAKRAMSVNSDADVLAISSQLKEDRENAEAYLDALERRIHQVVQVRLRQLPEQAIEDLPPAWQSASASADVRSLVRLIESVFDAREKRVSQVNWQSTVDRLLMNILEEKTKWHKSLA